MTVNELMQELIELVRDGRGQWPVKSLDINSGACGCEDCQNQLAIIDVNKDEEAIYIG